MEVRVTIEAGWARALDAARRTQGKEPNGKEPSAGWKRAMLLAEHSPIKLVEFLVSFRGLPQWVGVHFLRHEHVLPYIHTQRPDRNDGIADRHALPQDAPNDQDFVMNAQTLINISRKRLCAKAARETREAWRLVRAEVAKVDPETASVMVPNCVYSGFCREPNGCGWCGTESYKNAVSTYRGE